MYKIEIFKTASTEMSFCHSQDKAVVELEEILGKTDRSIILQDLPRFNYLERVIKETMRIYPPAHIIGRSVTEDVDLG